MRPLLVASLVLISSACRVDSDEDPAETGTTPSSAETAAFGDPAGQFDDAPTPEVIERERASGRWRAALPDTLRIDTVAAARAAAAYPETFDDVTPQAFAGAPALPLGGRVAGPAVVHAQVLLDRAGFSPGIIDGHWGDNVEKAVFFFQSSADLPATGVVDRATFDRLRERAGAPARPVVAHQLTDEDVRGPF